jgi:HK97 family phage prohead protease
MSTIAGYALVWADEAQIDGKRERFAPYPFREPLVARLVVSHDHRPGAFLASTGGTLQVSQDDTGLRFSAELDACDPYARRTLAAIRAGVLNGCSFGFRALEQREDEDGVTVTKAALQEITLTGAAAYQGGAVWPADAEHLPPRLEVLRKAWQACSTAGRPARVERELEAFSRTKAQALILVNGVPLEETPPAVRGGDPLRKAVRARLYRSSRIRAWA